MTRRLSLATGILVLVGLATQACGGPDTEASSTDPGPALETSISDCNALIPEDVLATLGWSPGSTSATLDSGICRRDAEQGYVTVERLPVAALGGDDLPAKAQQAYDEACAELDSFPDPDDLSVSAGPGQSVGWLGEDVTACAVEPSEPRAETTVVVLTPQDTVVQLRVVPDSPTSSGDVRAALGKLTPLAVERL